MQMHFTSPDLRVDLGCDPADVGRNVWQFTAVITGKFHSLALANHPRARLGDVHDQHVHIGVNQAHDWLIGHDFAADLGHEFLAGFVVKHHAPSIGTANGDRIRRGLALENSVCHMR